MGSTYPIGGAITIVKQSTISCQICVCVFLEPSFVRDIKPVPSGSEKSLPWLKAHSIIILDLRTYALCRKSLKYISAVYQYVCSFNSLKCWSGRECISQYCIENTTRTIGIIWIKASFCWMSPSYVFKNRNIIRNVYFTAWLIKKYRWIRG